MEPGPRLDGYARAFIERERRPSPGPATPASMWARPGLRVAGCLPDQLHDHPTRGPRDAAATQALASRSSSPFWSSAGQSLGTNGRPPPRPPKRRSPPRSSRATSRSSSPRPASCARASSSRSRGRTRMPAQIYQTKITSIVPEGSIVKEGDKIAELDRAPVATRLQSVTLNLQKAQADSPTARSIRRSISRRRARTCGPPSTTRGKEARQGAGAVRGADHQASGGDRLREGAARARPVEAAISTRRPNRPRPRCRSVGADLGRQQNKLKMVQDV